MASDYAINRIVKGATVKTTDEYELHHNSLFGKCEPVTEAIIIDIDPISQVTTLRLPNGKTRDINAFWLQLT